MNLSEFHELNQKVELGDPAAMYELAKLYRKGVNFSTILIPKNIEGARELLYIASKKGYYPAKNMLENFENDNLIKSTFREIPRLPLIIYRKIGKSLGEIYRGISKLLFNSIALVFALLLIGVICSAIYLIFKGVSALPISVAIILGALIIAVSLKK